MPMDANFDLEAIERAFVEAAVDPTKWKEAMTVAARATGSTGALLFDAQSHLPGIPQSENMEAATEAYIQGGWSERDVRYGILSRLLQKGVATDLDLFTADQIERHPYYQEFLAPHKLRRFAGGESGIRRQSLVPVDPAIHRARTVLAGSARNTRRFVPSACFGIRSLEHAWIFPRRCGARRLRKEQHAGIRIRRLWQRPEIERQRGDAVG
ncbi:hypothetical protein Q1M63_01640 (plasmid) [Sinorhizobium meliloti]|nr:hypothetical protein Q1M63_01640 [Sinorhizobium meliloti]